MNLRLKELRNLRGMSQEDMARKLGIKKSRYGTWERGERMLSAEQLCDCADVLECSADAILGREVPTSFIDPRQAELNRVWGVLGEQRRDRLLENAHDFETLERGGAQRLALEASEMRGA